MRAIPILLAALWLAPSAAAQTLPAVQRAVEGEACPIAPYDPDAPEGTLQEPEWWSAPERYAWREICAGNVADMQFSTGADDGAGCRAFTPDPEDPAQLLEPDAWPESRELRPRFLRQIAARQPFTDAPVRPVVHIACAQMTDRLDLSDETVPQALYIQNSRLPGASIANARFGRDLRFEGSHVDGDLTAWTARMEGALYMRNGRFGAISLLGADVAGNVETDGSTLTGPFNADGLRVGGYVFMRDMPAAAGIDLLGAEVAGNVETDGSTLTGLFQADRLRVGGSLLMREMPGAAGIDLLNAEVAGDVSTIRSTLTGLFRADRLRVGGSLFVGRGAVVDGDLWLRDASVGAYANFDGGRFLGEFDASGLFVGETIFLGRGSVFNDGVSLGRLRTEAIHFGDSRFQGAVDLSDAHIERVLLVSDGDVHPAWGSDAELNLSNSFAGAVQAIMPNGDNDYGSWAAEDAKDRKKPLPVDLTNFSYSRLGGYTLERVEAAHDRSGDEGAEDGEQPSPTALLLSTPTLLVAPERYIAWIENSRDASPADLAPKFSPQPYMQLSNALRAMGAEASAEAVDFARFVHRMDTREEGWLGPVDWLNRWVVGFGVYPERALAWFTGLVLLGWAVARRSPDLRGQGVFKPFFYSLENALPLIDLSGNFADIRHADAPRIANFFHFQKAAGFVLATVLVGALTILGG